MDMLKNLIPGLLVLLIISVWACSNDDEILTSPDAKLEFSTDTLTFDTVFTQIGSATRILKLYNRNEQSIEIQSISIASGANSRFRLNIDGEASNAIQNLIIPGNDSLYIFGEVTVNPDLPVSESPFVINDAIIFETNGNSQEVVLEAWGQNAIYVPDRFSADSINIFGCNGGEIVWNDPKPYVIYGIVAYDDCTLVLPAGAQLYFHGGLARFEDEEGNIGFYNDGRLVIGPNASLRSEGTFDNPVILQGDRLEEEFEEVSGQWYGLIFNPESTGNIISHTVIKNSVQGVVVDSLGSLELYYSQIYNSSSNGLFARAATVKAENCLFYNNGATAIRTSLGGNYEFNYCTVGAFGNDQQSIALSNGQCLGDFCQNFYAKELNATMRNCIFFGSNSDQIGLSDFEVVDFNYSFDHCLVRVDELLDAESHPDFFDNTNQTLSVDRDAAVFADINEDDYHLDTLSVAENLAIPIVGLELDLDNELRDANTPDLGCYEYQYE